MVLLPFCVLLVPLVVFLHLGFPLPFTVSAPSGGSPPHVVVPASDSITFTITIPINMRMKFGRLVNMLCSTR